LIVIDYHLDPGSIDNSKSIEILRRLADSPHFNTVIVYTSAELQDVWRDIAVNLRPDLRADYLLKDDDKETVWWLENDIKNFKEPDIDAIAQFVR
ncbi:response regulator receiver domain, partial [Acinetobacter baumannii]